MGGDSASTLSPMKPGAEADATLTLTMQQRLGITPIQRRYNIPPYNGGGTPPTWPHPTSHGDGQQQQAQERFNAAWVALQQQNHYNNNHHTPMPAASPALPPPLPPADRTIVLVSQDGTEVSVSERRLLKAVPYYSALRTILCGGANADKNRVKAERVVLQCGREVLAGMHELILSGYLHRAPSEQVAKALELYGLRVVRSLYERLCERNNTTGGPPPPP